MEERDIALLSPQEMWVAQTTQCVVGDLLYVWHGHGKNEREYAGVGFVVRKDIIQHITGYLLGGDGRIMVVGLDLAPQRLSVVTVYVPQNARSEEDRAGGFEALAQVVDSCQKKGATLVLGDCTARVHARLDRGRT